MKRLYHSLPLPFQPSAPPIFIPLGLARWQSGFARETPELQNAKARCRPGLRSKQKGGSPMILMLVNRLAFVGRVTALVVWTRKGQR